MIFTPSNYQLWIEAYLASLNPRGYARGRCGEATEKMIAAFPELRRVGGFVHGTFGESEHYWCVTPSGTIVDPTVSQFLSPTSIHVEYEEIADIENSPRIRRGTCMDCGEPLYGKARTFCDDDCERAYTEYMNGDRQ